MSGRVLAIDYGERRVGLAVGDATASMARGLPTIDRKALRTPLAEVVARVVAEEEVERVVLGIPYSLDGGEGPAAREARAFQAELEAALPVPVEEWDERLTTAAATRALRASGRSEREIKDRVDQLAAVLMLEGWLRRRAIRAEADAEADAEVES